MIFLEGDMDWIRVEEKNPPVGLWCIVTARCSSVSFVIHEAYIDKNGKWYKGFGNTDIPINEETVVTHWMPFPLPAVD